MKNHAVYLLFFFSGLISINLVAQDLKNPLYDFEIAPENKYWMGTEGQEFNVLTYFRGIKYDPENTRLPLNLAVVIDRSGSMEGSKIAKTIEAVTLLIKQLKKEDRLSIVSYSNETEVISKSVPVQDKDKLIRLIKNIKADGSTFLSGGLEEGYVQIRQSFKEIEPDKFINRVILLSDGQANVGITDENSLSRIAKEQVANHNISLTTMGFGADYNEKLMSKISIAGTGNYHFVHSTNEINAAFDKEFKSMASVIGKKVSIVIKFPSDVLDLRQVYLYNYDLEKNEISINLNDVFSDDQKALVTRFKLKEGADVSKLKFEATLSYSNPLKENIATNTTNSSEMEFTDSKSTYEKGFNPFAMLGNALVLSQERFQQSMDASEQDKFSEAESLLKDAVEIIDDYHRKFGSHPFMEDLLVDMKDYKKQLKVMQKKPKSARKLFYKKYGFLRHKGVCCPKFR